MLARVAGGTGAGRTMHHRAVPALPWQCRRGHMNKRYAARCMCSGCPERRPR